MTKIVKSVQASVLLAALCALGAVRAADTPPGPAVPQGVPSGGNMPNFITPAGPDTPEAAAHRAAAKAAAGTRWQNAYGFLCAKGPQRLPGMGQPSPPGGAPQGGPPGGPPPGGPPPGFGAPPPGGPPGPGAQGGSPPPGMPNADMIKPQWIFDNVALIGDRGTVMFVLKTSAGVVLIDSGYSDKLESILLPSLAQLGIEPSHVKYILVTHGHADHFGGAPYFQSHFGTHIVASAADWDMITAAPALLPAMPLPWMLAKGPKRDIVVGDGDEIVLGDMHISTFLIPGHTPGSLGFIFPVKDGGQTRTAAIFGGAILSASMINNDGLKQYVQSLAHFGDVTHKRHVDVELQNHPNFDDMWIKADALAARKPGESNPFVIGDPAYQSFLQVMSECTQATLAQRESAAKP